MKVYSLLFYFISEEEFERDGVCSWVGGWAGWMGVREMKKGDARSLFDRGRAGDRGCVRYLVRSQCGGEGCRGGGVVGGERVCCE